MIKINLLTAEPKVVAQQVVVSESSRTLLLVATLVLCLTAGAIGWRYWAIGQDSKRLDADIAAAQQETTRLQSVLLQVQQFEGRKTQLQQRVALIEQLRSDQTGPVHMLDQISRALPPLLWLTELKQTAVVNEVVMVGRCTTLTILSDFVVNLEASGYFRKSIEIVSSTAELLTRPPGELVRFEIKAIFQQPADTGHGVETAASSPVTPAAKSEN
jgi:type IV pilus assembly protein PilN